MLNAVTEVYSLKDDSLRASNIQGQKDERVGRDASRSQTSDSEEQEKKPLIINYTRFWFFNCLYLVLSLFYRRRT
jgi:hypothetical protein